jgi:hypothetical protein
VAVAQRVRGDSRLFCFNVEAGGAAGSGAGSGERHAMTSPDNHKRVGMELWEADAIVLLDWLEWVDFNAIPTRHRAEKQALMDLLNQLEQSIDEPTEQAVAEARDAVAEDMGW